jgi:hypothetical protein
MLTQPPGGRATATENERQGNMKRRYCVLACVGAVLAVAPASASAHFFTCRASAVRVDVLNPLTNTFAEPEVANQPGGNDRSHFDADPVCRSDLRQAASVAIPNPGPPLLTATVLKAQTVFTPCAPWCTNATPAKANASVTINLGGHTITATVLEAGAAAKCDSTAKERLSGSSSVLTLTIDGQSQSVSGPATIPIPPLLTVYINRQITGKSSDGDVFLTQRALEVSSPALGADIVAAEATADFNGTPCSTP